MRIFREWIQRFKGTLLPARRDADLEHELRSHMEIAAEDKRRRGLDPDDASRAARIEVGGASQAMDALRDQRGLPWLDDLARDVSHGLRTLRRAPVFTAVALLTLALGIGANTAIFSIVNGVILRPLDFPKPEQLMYLTTDFPALGLTRNPLSVQEYLEFRQMNRSFAAVGAYQNHGWGLHYRRSQPHGRRSTSARALGICRRAPAQHAWRSASAGTLLQRGRDRSCRGPCAPARDSRTSCGKSSFEDNLSLDKP